MPVFCVIDIGSNAIRMAINSVAEGRSPCLIYSCREAIRIGQDVFASGNISEPTIRRCEVAFKNFGAIILQHRVERIKAIGTSALREAGNCQEFINRIRDASGIEIVAIDGAAEAHLISSAVAAKVNIAGINAVLFDIGGGSVEIVLLENGIVTRAKSYQIGCVRLLQLYGQCSQNTAEFVSGINEHLATFIKVIASEICGIKPDLCLGLGGSVTIMSDLKKQLLGNTQKDILLTKEIHLIIERLQTFSKEELINKLHLKPDRADITLPAALTLDFLMKQFGMEEIMIPHVTLKDGVLAEMAREKG